ncbi:MAG: carbohydrate kinase family protein [Candidatus Thorarchaeota archaeon]
MNSLLDHDDLIEAMRNPPRSTGPVIMPDFFLDHFIIGPSFSEFVEDVERVAQQGGGNIIGCRHLIRRGGNSVNTASALLRLGLRPTLIVKTSPQGAELLRALVDPHLDLSHVHTDGLLSATVSIEVDYNGRRTNIMVSDSGSAADFSREDLDETDIEAIRAAPLVALLCLNHNRDPARLAREIFSLVRDVSGAFTFMDIGDPSSRPEILGPLVREVLCEGFVDILSVNENEVRWIARELGLRGKELTDKCEDPDEWLRCARFVAQETGSRVDLHTPFFSATLSSELEIVIPTFRVDVRVTCGAGDAWNAGDIFGTLLGISPDQRVVLANAVGALYVSSSEAEHPTLSDVEQFLRSNPSLTKLGNKLLKPP